MVTLITARTAIVLALIILSPMAVAQEQAAPDNEQSNVTRLVESVNAIASDLEQNIAAVLETLADTTVSREAGAELLERMRASVEAVHSSLVEDGNIWTELTRAMDIWDKNRQEALEKSETNPAFDEIAEEWSVKIRQAGDLRQQILTQRAESMAMLDQIMSDREVVLAYYDLGQADRALEAMQTVSDNLGRMNQSMRAIVDQTQVVAGGAVPQ
ncbi:MAG: hypothetical protein OXC69_08590 [Candidatus Tectomicrobia bacterium]|nr:hypothetical protein [Candidatus Tectomicrobia bacterium]